MSFKRINENYFVIDADGEELSISIEKILWHHCSFSLARVTENLETVNLFKVFNDIRDIVFLYLDEKPEIHDIFLQFNPNIRIDRDRWIKLCEYYLRRHQVVVHRIENIGLTFRVLK